MSTYYVQDFYKSDQQQIAHLKSKPGTNFKMGYNTIVRTY